MMKNSKMLVIPFKNYAFIRLELQPQKGKEKNPFT
jgi:hypothetical protein